MNYRSVVVYGTAELISDEGEQRAIFERMTDHFFPGRLPNRDYAAASLKDLRSVRLVAVRVDELSAKARTGGPKGPHDEDADALGSAYVIELPGLDA